MESLRGLKSRLGAVSNIRQITKAMEMVAATKMRRSQEIAIRSRPYAWKALELLEKMAERGGAALPLAHGREVKSTLVVVVAADRGLAGSFNAQVFRAADALLANDPYSADPNHIFSFASVGKRAEGYIAKKKLALAEKFYGFGDFVRPEEVEGLARFMIDGFKNGGWDRVIAISTNFRTALKQDVVRRQILPVDFEKIKEVAIELIPEYGRYADLSEGNRAPASPKKRKKAHYIFEPSAAEVLDELVPHLVKMQIYHLVLESNASEHSARRVAMKNASDSADELKDGLTLEYNKVRQSSITGEMIEIAATQNAIT